MTEVSKADYLSLVNKSGSGFNISELVEAMVSAEIAPRRSIENEKLEKTETAISGIGYLNSQVTKTMNNFDTIASDKFFTASSTKPASIDLNITDESKIAENTHIISDVSTAKKMIFEFGGFTSLSAAFSADLTVNFGSWSESAGTYTFTPSGATTDVDEFTGKTLQEVADILNSINGISAEIVDKTGANNNYSLTITSTSFGVSSGFQIVDALAGKDGRWETPSDPSSDIHENNFTQLPSDASFKLNGVTLTRANNSVSDVIAGATLELKSDYSSSETIITQRSQSAIKQSINDTIFSLNEFKSEIDRLTEIVIDGENGPLAMDPAVSILKSNFKKLSMEPLKGYGDNDIYMTELGIKTNAAGDYYLDEAIFNKTYVNNPEFFSALKDQNLISSKSSVSATKSVYTDIEPGKYVVSDSSGTWKLGDTVSLTQENLDDGGSSFSTSTYPGLSIVSKERDPGDFSLYVGKSFSQKIIDLMQDILKERSSIDSANTMYKTKNEKLVEKLDLLDQREKLLKSRYTTQFGDMESVMTQFNGTKTLLENLVNSWNQK